MKRVSFLVSMVLLAGTAVGQKCVVDWDHDADFSHYKTYAWMESRNPAPELSHKRIIEAVDKQMTAKGLQKVEGGKSDLLVVYEAGAKERVSVQGYDYGYGYRRFGGGMVHYDTYSYTDATLTVSLVDAPKKALVWRGTASDTLSDSPEKNQKKLSKATEKLFKKYPPK